MIYRLLGQHILFADKFGTKFFFGRQDKFVFRGKKLFMSVQHRVANHGLVLARAENDANGGIILRTAPQIIIHAHVHIHLANVLMGEVIGL